MKCLFCGSPDTAVSDSRVSDDGQSIRRRRTCPACNAKFSTLEQPIKKEIVVIKKDGTRTLFDRGKIFNSIRIAAAKRLSEQQINEMADGVCSRIESGGALQVDTSSIAGMVMDVLERADKVAYLRYASVYMNFETIEDVDAFVEKLRKI